MSSLVEAHGRGVHAARKENPPKLSSVHEMRRVALIQRKWTRADVRGRLAAPRNTPADVIEKLNQEVNAALAVPKLKQRLTELGAAPLTGSHAMFRQPRRRRYREFGQSGQVRRHQSGLIRLALRECGQMSESGLVSRVSPVQTALRNCTRDEGRSFEVGNQVLISSHRKLLLSKAMVVNVAETSGQDSGRQG